MIHVMINGLIIEAQTVTEVHIQMNVKQYPVTTKIVDDRTNLDLKHEDNTITTIMREILADVAKYRRG